MLFNCNCRVKRWKHHDEFVAWKEREPNVKYTDMAKRAMEIDPDGNWYMEVFWHHFEKHRIPEEGERLKHSLSDIAESLGSDIKRLEKRIAHLDKSTESSDIALQSQLIRDKKGLHETFLKYQQLMSKEKELGFEHTARILDEILEELNIPEEMKIRVIKALEKDLE